MLEQILVALIGFFGRCKTGEHAHGPELAAVAGRVNAARVGRLAGVAEILIVVPVGGEIGLRVKAADGHIRNCAETSVAVGLAVGAGGRADGLLGSFLDGGRERLFGPGFFGGRRVTASNTSAIGFSATDGLGWSAVDLFSGMRLPTGFAAPRLAPKTGREPAAPC